LYSPGLANPERDAAAALDQVGLEPGEQRRRQAGAAVDLVEVPDLVVPDGDRHPDLVAEVPVAQRRHIRYDAHAHAVDDVLRHDTLLVVGLGERLGDAAGAALTELSWRRREPGRGVLAEAGLLGLPAGLPEVAAVGADGQARAADQRDPRVAARVLQRRLVPEVAGGEVDRDPSTAARCSTPSQAVTTLFGTGR
jgi:hypothetical protein